MNFSINNVNKDYNQSVYNKKNTGKQVSFGSTNPYDDDAFEIQNAPTRHLIRNAVKLVTGSALNIVGFNIALYYMQHFVNSKLLVGISKHFTNKINDNNKLETLAADMKSRPELNLGQVKMFQNGDSGDAYFTHVGNKVVVGTKEYSSLFHELGHGVIENNTKFLKFLQHGRGNYTVLAFGLYALLSQNKNSPNGNNKTSNKLSTIIPLLAYSPELITEGMATKYGLKYLKSVREDVVQKKFNAGKIAEMLPKEKMVTKEMFNNIKHSYLACFGTYLFVPLSIIILDKLDDWAHKRN